MSKPRLSIIVAMAQNRTIDTNNILPCKQEQPQPLEYHFATYEKL